MLDCAKVRFRITFVISSHFHVGDKVVKKEKIALFYSNFDTVFSYITV